MGGSNPFSGAISGVTTLVRGSGRALRDNPTNLIGLPFNGINTETERLQRQTAGANAAADSARAKAAKAAEDRLIAEESVRAQKERARKQTVFGGGNNSNLFNRSLIGASTTAAAGTSRSILGA